METIERFTVSQDWITLLLLVVFVLLVTAKYIFPHRFTDFSMLFATNKYLLLQGKEGKIFHPFNALLFGVNVVSVGLFIYIFYQIFVTAEIARPKFLFIRIATAYAAFVLLKFSLEKIVANIISIDKLMNDYIFYKLSYRNFIAMILLPVNLLFIYVWKPDATALLICLGIIFLLNLITLLAIFRKNQQQLMNHWFYFILYLCALEIGPYFILYKLFTN